MGDASVRCATGPGFTRSVLLLVTFALGSVAPLAAAPVLAATTNARGSTGDVRAAESAASVTFRVFATREGGVGLKTASGHVITENDRFVALPSFTALNKRVRIAYKGKSAVVPVLDVGPWNNNDDYWMPSDQRSFKGLPRGVPQAQAAFKDKVNDGKSGMGETVTVPTGIDIGDGTWADLGLTGNDYVDVTFLFLTDDPTGGVTGPAAAASPTPTAPARASADPTSTASGPRGAAASASSVPASSGLDTRKMPVRVGSEPPPLDRATAIGNGYAYVSQTGHNIPEVFNTFWKERGGVPIFGYPLSEVFVRKSGGETHIFQYFERVVFEYLEESDTVALAPIGSWFAAIEGPYDTIEPFESTAKNRYVAKTGHSISGGILQWYLANGGAALFGDPLNEAEAYTTPDGRSVTAQLFERARIELDARGAVTLGRLGAEWLAQRGWT